jgi:hypothetical protein
LRLKTTSPKLTGKEAASVKWITKTRLAPVATAKPLVPVTERKSQEENNPVRRPKKVEGDGEKWDITPDGGSAGREGRQFTVANVGNNGRIYLR